MSDIYLAGGCFWGMEKYLASIHGVSETQVGYANGQTADPTYEQVCHNHTGHAETVRVHYDAAIVPLSFLLEIYYSAIDPHRSTGRVATPGRSTAPASTIPTRLIVR